MVKAPERIHRVYLETSSLNALASDPYLAQVLTYLVRSTGSRFYVSETVIQQITHCDDHDRMRHLLAVLHSFGARLRVFEDPKTVLRKAAAASAADRLYDPLTGTDRPTRWLRDVNTGRYALRSSDVAESAQLYRRQADAWVQVYSESRQAFRSSPVPAHERTRAHLIRQVVHDPSTLPDFATEVANIGRKASSRLATGNVLRDPMWQAYLLTLGLSAHRAMCGETDFAPRKLPDPADIVQAVFLPIVDVFLVDDRRFASALRAAGKVAHLPSRVQSYVALRDECLLALL